MFSQATVGACRSRLATSEIINRHLLLESQEIDRAKYWELRVKAHVTIFLAASSCSNELRGF
ncbi:hypothetical protein ABFA07_001736 [Porites harrisoni]